MSNIIGFGEILLRYEVLNNRLLSQSNELELCIGGAELNSIVSLAKFGHNCSFMTVLPENKLAQKAIDFMKVNDVEAKLIRGDGRVGSYFLEKGIGHRPSSVIYDRTYTLYSMTELSIEFIEATLEGIDLLHVTGINLAISEVSRNNLFKVLDVARAKSILISFDFNYRGKLWSIEDAKPYYQRVIPYVDYLFAWKYDAHNFLDIDEDKDIDEVISKYGVKAVFHTVRNTISANENELKAFGYMNDKVYSTNNYKFDVLDRIGGGDAFVAGVLHKILLDKPLNEIVEFGLSASILKHTIHGDANMVTEQMVLDHVVSSGNMVVQR